MADTAHLATDKELEKMERHLSAIYARAEKELQEKADAYFKRFEELDAKKRELVEAGKMTEQEYKRWRQNKIMTGKHWTAMKEQAAQELLQANKTAQEYINGRLPGVYTLNYNRTSEGISEAVSGYSFELVDASTVKNLATSDKTLLPYKYVDGKKDVRWNTTKVNSEVLQGIVQGESIPNIAKRLQNVTEMNRASAIRNARTMVTSAENKGRMDSFHRAEEMGIQMKKIWIATSDARTRDAHAELDGEEADVDEPFVNSIGEIMFPGDPDAHPANTYNCRCSLGTKILGFDGKKEEKMFTTPIAEDIAAANEYGTQTLGNIYDQHNSKNELRRVDFSDANKLTQTVGADYSNLSVGTANVFNRQITNLANDYDTPLQRVRTMAKQEAVMSQNTFARVNHNYAVDSAEMIINPVKCKDVSTLTERIIELQEKGYCVKIQQGREAEYIVTHEFAHTMIDMGSSLSQNFVNANFKTVKSARTEIESIYTDYIAEVSKRETAFKQAEFDFIMGNGTSEMATTLKRELDGIKLSNYSMLNADEFLAESFTNQKIGVAPNPYAERAVSVLDKYFGR